ncbi:MAG: hypothetical protein RBT74_07870 [Tenuifilaceae bacterium]|jgi:hypothetical protein|nr:hypothetical protein [Tenuifilaceae bacterium]
MQQCKGIISVKKLRLTAVLVVMSFLTLSACTTKSISNPYGAKKSKPKPCKCGTRKRPGLTHQDNHLPVRTFAETAKPDFWGKNIIKVL